MQRTRQTTTKTVKSSLSSNSKKGSIKLSHVMFLFVLMLASLLVFLHASVLSIDNTNNTGVNDPKSSSSVQQQEESNNNDDNYHMVFSTSCSPFQNWQSYVLFYSALRIHQPGHVTRIASGCSPEEGEALQQEFTSSIASMSPHKFHLHLSPEFRDLGSENHNMSKNFAVTKYFNKPFGLLHWMEQEMKYKKGGTNMDTILILVDPDMLLLRPITGDYINDESMLWEDPSLNNKNERNNGVRGTKVEHGNPLGSRYGYGAIPFRKFDLMKIIPDKNSPVHGVKQKDGAMYYPAG